MDYQIELDFARRLLERFRLRTTIIAPDMPLPEDIDMGLRSFFGGQHRDAKAYWAVLSRTEGDAIYKVSDVFGCRYVFFRLPRREGQILVIGPYIFGGDEPNEELWELTAEQYDLPTERSQRMKKLLAAVPRLPDESMLQELLQVLGESMWGSAAAFHIVDVDHEFSRAPAPLGGAAAEEDVLLNMRLMEDRYSYENELMRIVSQGMVHRAEQIAGIFSQMGLERRSVDLVRDVKNYCIVCNTLLRKAAEQGGVHPLYLDRHSSSIAKRIETVCGPAEGEALMSEMIQSYCRLVRKHATARYSGVVQKSIAYIDADLSADLSLHTVAAAQKVTPAYLSAQFRKETGSTLTEHVNEKRIRLALHLLRTTHLQVQAVAQRCGIQDPNYFVRLFKKQVGVTPSQYRRRGGQEN